MQAFEVLGDPVRRRVLELIADGEVTSGGVCAVIRAEFGISQPAVSQHLRVLRDSGFATVRAAGTRRLYTVNPEPLREVAEWLDPFRRFWAPHLDALATELARGRRERRLHGIPTRRAWELIMMEVIEQINAVRRRVGQPHPRRGRGAQRDHQPGLRRPHRRRLGRLHQPRPDPPLVPAGHRRPEARRPLPARGQRERHRRALRPSPGVHRHLGVRRADQLDRGPADQRAAGRDAARTRAHR